MADKSVFPPPTYVYDGVKIDIEEKDKYGHKRWMLYTCDACGKHVPAPWNGLPKIGYSLAHYAGKEPNRRWYLCGPRCVKTYSMAMLIIPQGDTTYERRCHCGDVEIPSDCTQWTTGGQCHRLYGVCYYTTAEDDK